MKLKTLFAITVIVNSTSPQTFYHIFTYSSLDFLHERCRMPRSGRKTSIGDFFLLTQNFIITILKLVKEYLHKKVSMANFGD